MRSKIADQIMKDTPQELKDKVRESSATFIAVESYKKALRERIEYEVAYHERTGPMAQSRDGGKICYTFVKEFVRKALSLEKQDQSRDHNQSKG